MIAAFAVVTTVLDLVVVLLPVPRLLKLNISRSKKIGVIMVFTAGVFVTVCSVMRLGYLIHYGTSPKNPTWQYTPLELVSRLMDKSVTPPTWSPLGVLHLLS
jgi:hypothetical protein